MGEPTVPRAVRLTTETDNEPVGYRTGSRELDGGLETPKTRG